MIHFVRSVSFKNLEMEAFLFAVEQFQPTRKWLFKLTLRSKWIMPSGRALKSVPENGVGHCVHFCLRSLGALERCFIGRDESNWYKGVRKKFKDSHTTTAPFMSVVSLLLALSKPRN